jgi:hypothetical protein
MNERDPTSDTPDWSVWRPLRKVKVWQGVALSLDVEPTTIRHESLESAKRLDTWARLGGFQASIYIPVTEGALLLGYRIAREFNQRVAAAMCELEALGSHPIEDSASVPNADCDVSLPTFAAWVVRLGWSVPPEFAALAQSNPKGERNKSWCIRGKGVARDLADAWADLNGLPRGEGAALAYELQVRRAIDAGIKVGAVRKRVLILKICSNRGSLT